MAILFGNRDYSGQPIKEEVLQPLDARFGILKNRLNQSHDQFAADAWELILLITNNPQLDPEKTIIPDILTALPELKIHYQKLIDKNPK